MAADGSEAPVPPPSRSPAPAPSPFFSYASGAPSAPLSVEPLVSKLEHFSLYETDQRLYVVATDAERQRFRMLKITLLPEREQTRAASLSEILAEDQRVYGTIELNLVLQTLHEGNSSTGGLRHVLDGFGLVGFSRFIGCYYLTVITQRRVIGQLGGNDLYTIQAVENIALQRVDRGGDGGVGHLWGQLNRRLNPTAEDTIEQRYRDLFNIVDLTRDFFFSYTYDITQSLQFNMLATAAQNFPPPPPREMWTWNHYLLSELDATLQPKTQWFWYLPIMHGAVAAKRFRLFSRTLTVSLIARRSRHYAGTRYLKRGVSDLGHVANDVETEQILHEEGPKEGKFASMLQVRGSIPTFWMQETSVTQPKPPIIIKSRDPTYDATRLHLADLVERYGPYVQILDLVKQREGRDARSGRKRELLLGQEFRSAMDFINSDLRPHQRIPYLALDFSNLTKIRSVNLVKALAETARWSLAQTNIFASSPRFRGGGNTNEPMVQRGILRTNCIDCLDRSNVAQFVVGAVALGMQLNVLGIEPNADIPYDAPIVQGLMDLYTSIGDIIAMQYGGSEAQKKVDVGTSSTSVSMKKHSDLLTSIRRYYSNSFLDDIKQDAMNLFLGHFRPFSASHAGIRVAPTKPAPSPRGRAQHYAGGLNWAWGGTAAPVVDKVNTVTLWELESDFYLHNHKPTRRARRLAPDEWHQYEGDLEPDLDWDDAGDDVDEETFFRPSGEDWTIDAGIATEVLVSPQKLRKKGMVTRALRRASKMMKARRGPRDPVAKISAAMGSRAGNTTALTMVYEPPPPSPRTLRHAEERMVRHERRQRVRQWCRKEFFAAAQWWDNAVLRHEQRLQWMRLGPPPELSLLDRFERKYWPQELTSFDDVLKEDMHITSVYEAPAPTSSRSRAPRTVRPRRAASHSWDASATGELADALPDPDAVAQPSSPSVFNSTSSKNSDHNDISSPNLEILERTEASPTSASGSASPGLASPLYALRIGTRQRPSGRSYTSNPPGTPPAVRKHTEDSEETLLRAASHVRRRTFDSLEDPPTVTRELSSPRNANALRRPHNRVQRLSEAAISGPGVGRGAMKVGDEEDERNFSLGGFMRDLGSRLVRSLRTVRKGAKPGVGPGQGVNGGVAKGFFAETPDVVYFGTNVAPFSDVGAIQEYVSLCAAPSLYETFNDESIAREWPRNPQLADFVTTSTDAFHLYTQSEKNYCTRILAAGPYKGLPQRASASTVQRLTTHMTPIVGMGGEVKSWDDFEAGLTRMERPLRKQIGTLGAEAILDSLKATREADLEALDEYRHAIDPEKIRQKTSTLLTPNDFALYMSYADPFAAMVQNQHVVPSTREKAAKTGPRHPELLNIASLEPRLLIAMDCRGLLE